MDRAEPPVTYSTLCPHGLEPGPVFPAEGAVTIPGVLTTTPSGCFHLLFQIDTPTPQIVERHSTKTMTLDGWLEK